MGKKSRGKKKPPPGTVPLGNLPGNHLEVQRTRAVVESLAKRGLESAVSASQRHGLSVTLDQERVLPPGVYDTGKLGQALAAIEKDPGVRSPDSSWATTGAWEPRKVEIRGLQVKTRNGSKVPEVPVTPLIPAVLPVQTASEVLDTHAILAEFMKSPPPGLEDYMQSFMASVYEQARDKGGDLGQAQAWAYLFYPAIGPREFLLLIGKQLADAKTYQVTRRMVAEVNDTYVKSLKHVDHMSAQEVPSEAGFVWFDQPAEFVDAGGKSMTHRALSWAVQTTHWGETGGRQDTVPALRITTWCHADDLDDYWDADVRQDLFEVAGRMTKLTLAHSVIMPFGQRFLNRLEEQPEEPVGDDIARWLHTLFLYLNAEITVSSPGKVARSLRRRAQRSLKHGQVNVITLRRIHNIADPSGQHRRVDWSCRWPVQPHWRHIEAYEEDRHHAVPARGDRLVPGEDPDHDHCLRCGARITWVRAAIKGPTWLPLKQDRQLYKLAR